MPRLHEMIACHPGVQGSTNDTLINCIQECYVCAPICISCADACLAEDSAPELRQCIRLNLDCADLCLAAGSLGTRRTGSNEVTIVAALEACRTACRLCAEECRRCERACDEAVQSIQA